MNNAAIKNLRENQQQLDMDGVMVGVSRQALDELIMDYESLEEAINKALDQIDNPEYCRSILVMALLENETITGEEKHV